MIALHGLNISETSSYFLYIHFFSSLTLNLHCGSWILESVMNSNWTIVQDGHLDLKIKIKKLTLFSSFLNHIPLNKNLSRWGSKNYAVCQVWFVMDHGFIDGWTCEMAEHVKCWWVRKSQTVAEQIFNRKGFKFQLSCY